MEFDTGHARRDYIELNNWHYPRHWFPDDETYSGLQPPAEIDCKEWRRKRYARRENGIRRERMFSARRALQE